MDKNLEQSLEVEDKQADNPACPEASASGASRRRFSRSAVAGSAVILSLGNRAAWSTQVACVSATTMASYAANATSSISPATMAKIEELQTAANVEGMTTQTDPETGMVCVAPETVEPVACFTPPGQGNGQANGQNPDNLPICDDTTGG